MRGKVLVEEELQGKPTNTFVERYFVSFPFCGVRWFKLEPELSSSTDEQLLHRSDSSCGWVYGGNVFPVAVAALDTIEYQLQDWYAFKLTLKSGEHVRDFRLACRYVTERTAWIVDSESALQAQHFVKAFSEHDTLPLPELLSCLVAEDNDLRLNNYWLTNSILQSINGFFRGLYPEGSILQGLFMQNCQLGDSQVPLVCAVIANLPYINKLSLSENIITSEGCTVLCETLNKTKYLGLLDLSNNYLDDDCAEGLAKCLARLPDLNSLNLSRNQFTNESTKPFFLKLGKHSSALISIDFSYNIMGDEVASLVAILLYIRPSQVRSVNLSFCGVGDLGVKELSDALPSCSTLENLHLAGTYIKHRTLQILVEAIGKHHSSYTKKGQEGLHVSLGGILQDHDKALTLSYRSLRYALPYVGESTLVKSATLRKRLFQGSYGLDQSQDFCSDAINQDYPIICIRVLFPDSIDSPEELLEALALSLSLDTCQFRLLSSKKIVGDSPKLHFIVFTLELVPETRKFQIQSSSKYSDSLHGFNDRDQGWRPLKELSNLSVVLRLMHEMAIQSHPLLRMLGIRTVYLQYSEVNADGEGNSVTTENLVIEGASSGGKGLLDGYLPTLAPNEILEDDVDQEEEQEDDIWNMEEDVTDVPLGKDGLVEEETDEARLRSNQLAIQQRETQRRNFRMENERMILAVRQLYRDGLVNGSVAKFWEGAFGHLKYREHTRKILQHVIDPVSEVYIGVRKRQLLCEAMLQRDLPTLTYLIDSAIANCEENQLGVTFIYAQRLQSEIQSLIRRFKDLEVLATSYEELNTVEEYLLACGRSAYSGPEMFLAVDLRQQLVASAASKGISSLQDDLTYIQTRALFSNLLISRDMDTLRARIDDLKYSSEEQLLLLPETFTAQTMLRDFDNTLVELQQAMIAKDIDRLCDTVAFAAYSYIYDDVVQEAHAAIVSLSKNPAKLLEPIVAGLRENSKQKIDKAFEFCKRMGVKHEAIESRVCAGIFVAKSKIFDDDSIKSKLIKISLAIKNGFDVPATEMMQLLRRAAAVGLDKDPSLKTYMQSINKEVRKFASLMKQERHIQKMIDMDDIPGLTKLLSGRGDGKLVMHCKSKYAMEEWKVNLEECCSGKFLESLPVNEYGKKDVNAICMKSTFEKAARNTKGLVGGWKRRYFVLQATNMQYYTKQYGTKKGEIRVLGGGIRVLEPSEAGGRKYCLELEEGRDITLIDPDLIEEAKKTVRKAKIKSIRIDLRKGIKAMSLELLTKALQLASDLDVIQGPVIEEAKLCVRSIKEKSIKRDVLVAAKLVPKAQLRELISIAETVNLDPNIKSYRRLLILADKSELFQHIMRARGALEIKNEEMFVKAFKAIIRTDLKQFTTLDRLMLTAVIFQHTGYVVLKMATQGVPVHLLSKLFRHALSCSSQLLVETEPMDLGKIMMMMFAGTENINIRQSMVHTRQPLSSQGKIANISSYLDGIKLFLPDPQFAIFKYPRLRAYSSHKSRGLGITNPFSQRRNQLNALELLDHTTTGIAKSLLKYDPLQGVDQKYCIEAFHALQVIMGDLTVASIPRWTRKGSLFAEKEVYKIVVNLIELASKKQPLLANEIYFQCVKQLTSNPSDQSLIRGWILLTLYFHTFPPSKDSLGYLQHFVTSSISELQQKREAIKTDTGVPKDDDDGNDKNQFNAEEFRIQKDLMLRRNKYLLHLTGYCDFLLRTLEVYYLRDHASLIARTKREENLSLRPYPVFPSNSVISKDMVELAFEQNPIEIEVVLMTGSIIRLNISYGQFYSPYTLLQFLFERIVAIDEYNSVFDTYVDIYEEAQGSNVVEVLDAVKQDATVNAATDKTLTSRQKESEDVKTNRLQSLFRGFGLYCTDESDLNDAKSMVDLQKIPVQPKSDRWIDWTYDLQWDLLLNNAQNVPTENFLHDDKSTKFKSSNTLVLRRKVAMRSEFFADTYQIFGTQIPENDSTALVNLWNNWLQTTGQVLPLDSLRLDLIFAEDTRAVNSGLYPLSTDSFHYLMGLQVAICWINESAALWGDGDDDVADGANLSIRPCYKFRPKHLLHERKILTDKNGEDIKVSSPMSEEIDPAARQIRSSVRKSAPRRSVWQIGKSSTPSADSESDNSVTENEEKQRDSDVSSDESEINRMVEETKKKLQMQEDSEYESDASSEYVSSVESDDSVLDETMAFRTKARNPIKSFASMTELEREELLRILESIGVNMDNVSLEKLVHWISQFHEVAVDAKIPLTSPKYRYLLKRAYTHYLMSCPLYGCSYFSSVLLTESLKKNNRKTAAFETEDSGKDKTNEIVHSKNTLDFNQDILVCIDSTGITFLDPDSWAIIFKSPIHDLLEVRLRKFSEFVQFYDIEVSKKQEEKFGRQRVLTLDINSLKIKLISREADPILDALDSCCRELLGRGCFPYGTEGGDDLVHSSSVMGKATNASNVPHSIVPIIPYTDNKEILKRYLQEYPILPRPPVPLALIHHEIPESHKFMGYFDPPKSRREVLAEERAEADRLEFELTRLAAEAVMERNQRNMEQGRENMKKYKADVVVAGDEEDDEGSDEGQPDRPCNRDSTTGNQVKKNRKNRSIFNQNKNTEEIRAQILKERLNANVCGNTQSTGINGRHKEYSTPFIPLRIGGTIAMEPAERRRVVHGPVFEEHYQDRSDAKSPSKRLSVNWKRSAAVGVKTVDIPIKTLTTSSAISQSNPIESILRQSSIGISNFLMRHTEESDLYEREMNLLKVGEDSETEDLEDYDAEEGILTYASIKDITDRRVKTGDRRRLLDVYMYGLNQQKIPRKTEKTADGEAALKEDEAEENIHAELVAN